MPNQRMSSYCGRQMGFRRAMSRAIFMADRIRPDATHCMGRGLYRIARMGLGGFLTCPNSVCPDARYVRVATGLDYGDAAACIWHAVGEWCPSGLKCSCQCNSNKQTNWGLGNAYCVGLRLNRGWVF